jgi:2,5-dihydroxypyridine 5,6-dioxygenase
MRVQERWLKTFESIFRRCQVAPGEVVRVLTETDSRPISIELAELALARLGAVPVRITVPSLPVTTPVPVRSTGASHVIQHLKPVLAALSGEGLVVDLTVEGLLHAPELAGILGSGARVMMISNEHPEILERLTTDLDLTRPVKNGVKRLLKSRLMHVSSAAGTDLHVDVSGAAPGAVWGGADRPGLIQHWPGGLCLCFPKAGAVNGTLVMDVEGQGLDAELMRSYLEAWGDREAYAVSHVGWGMNPRARWDALQLFDKADCNGTELRAFAGNFLYSTGANEVAGRHTLGHFDLPMRHCTIRLDDTTIVEAGRLCPVFD